MMIIKSLLAMTVVFGMSFPGAAAYELSYRQPVADVGAPAQDHDAPSYASEARIPVVRSRMPERPLSDPVRTFVELNRGGSDVFRQKGALPYLVLGVAALASDRQTQKWFPVSEPGAPKPKFAKTFNHFGDGKIILPAIAVMYFAGRGEQKDTAKLWAAAVVNSTLISQSVKMITGKERPNKSPDAIVYHGPSSLKNDSFPSGHMTIATASAVILGHQYPRMKIPLYALAACVGLARIEGRNHWPSDVYWGAGVGYYGAWQAIRHKDEILTWRF